MKFNFYTDSVTLLEKAETEDYYEIEGLASTQDEDLQKEVIDQDGLDLSDILDGKGYFNSNHGHGYDDKPGGKDLARMGIIDDAKLTKKGLWVKGKIFKNHPEAGIYRNELKYGKPGLVQFSVEGNVVDRDSFDKSRVKRAKVRGVALTRSPVNPKTYARLVKSLAGEEIEEKNNLTPEQKYEVLKNRYDALLKGYVELNEKYQGITNNYNKSVDQIDDLKKSLYLSDKEKVKKLIKSRIEADSNFRDAINVKIIKALTPGGPQYATETPGDIEGGSVFMTESKEDRKKKKKKKKDNKLPKEGDEIDN